MSRTLCGIFRLLHGAQGQAADQRLFPVPSIFFLQFLPMHFIRTDMQGISEIIDKRGEFFDLLLIRFSCVRYKNGFLPEIILCHRLVCDQSIKILGSSASPHCARTVLCQPAGFIQNDSAPETNDRAASCAFPEDRRHMLRIISNIGTNLYLRAFCFILIRKDLLHARITHSAVYFDDRLRDLVVNDFSLFHRSS